ncbi:YrzO family protein [Bacillus cereus]|nr:YrzO family protein [Bacillus cereus]
MSYVRKVYCFFFAVGVACELAAINRNGRKKIKQQAEMIQLFKKSLKRKKHLKKTTGHRRSSSSI